MNILKLENLSKKYNEKVLLDAVNFEFQKGTTYIISGESGCGKTTLLNIIAGYIYADDGKVIVDPNVRIEYLFQDEMLFSNLTVSENIFIKYSLLYDEKDNFEIHLQELLSKFNILDLQDRKVAMLSGGERQRVQFANILLSNPDIILMDEPTSKLDLKNKETVVNTVNEVFKDKMLIIIDHENSQTYNNCVHLSLAEGQLNYAE